MNKREYEKLRSIKDPSEVVGAVYAVNEFEWHPTRSFQWWTMLDENLNEIEKVTSQYSFDGKITVLHREAERNSNAYRAYDTKEFGHGFIQFVKNDMTDALTIAAAESLTPDRKVKRSSLKSLRIQAGMTQAELADRVGISVRTLQDYEQGQKDIGGTALRTAVKMAEVLGCKPEHLLD
jgi:DNA-binding XRE family transcriptional regulator